MNYITIPGLYINLKATTAVLLTYLKQTIMEKSIKNSEIHKVSSLHSEICVAYNNDFAYRKAYKGDWGHWDDLPETSSSNLSCAENDGNSIGQNESPSENTYL